MRPEQIFIGDIRKCTFYKQVYDITNHSFFASVSTGYKYDSSIYKQNATLVKLDDKRYVDIENLYSILDRLRLIKDKIILSSEGYQCGGLYRNWLSGYMMYTKPSEKECLFVDEDSLKPYYSNEESKNISVRQLKKSIKKAK